jgi:hypothetical protein
MKLNLAILGNLVKVYGAPLYGADAVAVAGTIGASEYTVIDDNTLMVLEDGKTMYFPIRRSVVEAGFDADRVFTIGIFEAERDASGERDGVAWSVTKGQQKVFAY